MSTPIVSIQKLATVATVDQLASYYTACLAESAAAMGGTSKRTAWDNRARACVEILGQRGYRIVRSVMDESVFYAERIPAKPVDVPADPFEGLS